MTACWGILCVLAVGLGCVAAQAQTPNLGRLKAEAEIARQQGKDELARSLYAQALAQDAGWIDGWWRYGGLLYEARDFQAARTAFSHLTQLAPQNSLGFALLGMCEYELGDWNNASLHLNKAVAQGGLPRDIANAAMYDFGLTLMQQHNRNGALIVFRLLQHDAPQTTNLQLALGSAELNLEQLPAPESDAASAANLAGEAAIAVLGLKTDRAEQLYRQLVQSYPSMPFTHLCLGLFLENLGREAEAQKQFLLESEVDPSTPDAWIWLARIALLHREGTLTRQYASQAQKLAPNDGLPLLLLGKGYALDGQWKDAMATLQRAEALSPESYEVHLALVSVYGELNDPEGAAAERKLFTQTYAAVHPQGEGQR